MKIKYTTGSDPKNDQIIYVNDDAKIAGKLIDVLFDYINNRIVLEDNITARYLWKILSSGVHHVKNWVNKNDVGRLLDEFEKELKNRRK